MLKFQSNIIKIEEVRRSLGKKEEVDEERLFNNLIANKAALDQIEKQGEVTKDVAEAAFENQEKAAEKQRTHDEKVAKEQTKQADANATGLKGNGKVANNSTKDVESRNRPENQHGKTSVKIKESSVGTPHFLSKSHTDKEKHKKVFQSVYNKWLLVRNDILKGEDHTLLLGTLHSMLYKEIELHLVQSIQDGRNRALKELKATDTNIAHLQVSISQIEDDLRKTLNNLIEDLKTNLDKQSDAGAVFESLEYRLRFLLEYSIPKAYWFGYVRTCSSLGVDKVYVNFKGSHDADNHKEVINTKQIDWKAIPAFHAFCDCELSLKKEAKQK